MVWDREKPGPAKIGDRPMVRLTEAEAEQAMSSLTVSSNRMKGSQHLGSRTWEVKYGGSVTLPCAHENDAKLLARELLKKGHRVSARTIEGFLPARSIEDYQIYAWLAE